MAALRSAGAVSILDAANVATSFPAFRELAHSIGMKIEVADA